MVDATVVTFDPAKQRLDTLWREGQRRDLEVHGDPSKKVDVVIVAQGYDGESPQKVGVDFYRMKEVLFGKEPFKGHRADFNVYGVVGDVGADFGTFGIDRYLMTFSVHRLHDLIGTTPCDFIIVMVNSDTYGGGAIYNFYANVVVSSATATVLPHEFGHTFAGLADEYIDEDISYIELHATKIEPLQPNITSLVNFDKKWKDLVEEGLPIPTPVSAANLNKIGAYEGGGYRKQGIYRPAVRCMMGTGGGFCAVSSLHRMAEYVLPHEFGHAFGGLADEYVDEEMSYSTLHLGEREPLEPNITNLKDFASKWQSMLGEGTPVPTPADESVPKGVCGPLGVYEGAGYSSKGVYRPAMHCMMRDYAPFCPVCAKRLEEIFGLYTR